MLSERLTQIKSRTQELESLLANPEDLLKDQKRYQECLKELARLKPIAALSEEYERIVRELADIEALIEKEKDHKEMLDLYREECGQLQSKRDELQAAIEEKILAGSDADQDRNLIMEIRAGTGGEEAALFARDLFRMYSRYAGEHDLRIEVMNTNMTGKGGFKEVIFGVTGSNAYAQFRFESGTHRVQRVPETEASGRIHTSAATVAVLPEPDEVDIEIKMEDLRIDICRSGGPGGQGVNTTDSAVQILHIPTGLIVRCQDERSQHKNKAKAMRVLRARLYEQERLRKEKEYSENRKKQVGSGDRSEKIRTYNFPDRRVTDHRIGLTLHSLDQIMEGKLDDLIKALADDDRQRRLQQA